MHTQREPQARGHGRDPSTAHTSMPASPCHGPAPRLHTSTHQQAAARTPTASCCTLFTHHDPAPRLHGAAAGGAAGGVGHQPDGLLKRGDHVPAWHKGAGGRGEGARKGGAARRVAWRAHGEQVPGRRGGTAGSAVGEWGWHRDAETIMRSCTAQQLHSRLQGGPHSAARGSGGMSQVGSPSQSLLTCGCPPRLGWWPARCSYR